MMRHAVLVDTGPLYAIADRSDQHHVRAHEEFASLEKERRQIALPYPTMMEAYTLIMRHLGVKFAHQWLDSLVRGGGLLDPSPNDYRHAIQRIMKYTDQQITLFDAVLAILSDRLQVPVWTHDADFDLMGAQVWRIGT